MHIKCTVHLSFFVSRTSPVKTDRSLFHLCEIFKKIKEQLLPGKMIPTVV